MLARVQEAAKTYEERKVERTEGEDFCVSTAKPFSHNGTKYETAIFSPCYNNGLPVVVENHECEEDARDAHEEWVKIMGRRPLPKVLYDLSSSPEALELDKESPGWRVACREGEDEEVVA